jgi:hypothetical protein
VSAIRASDADRQRATETLRSHFAAGRLELDDLERRLQTALDAKTIADIEALADDLPDSAPAVRATDPAQAVRVGGWGNREFRQEHVLPAARTATWQQAITHLAPAMGAYGYSIVDGHEPDFIVFELTEKRVMPYVLLLGPLGLLAPSTQSRVAVSLIDLGEDQTKLVAAGTARRAVRRAFAAIRG